MSKNKFKIEFRTNFVSIDPLSENKYLSKLSKNGDILLNGVKKS